MLLYVALFTPNGRYACGLSSSPTTLSSRI
jgi:hypothetical protein